MKHYEVVVIKPGYAEWAGPSQQRADGTITLVKGAHNLVVDTGGPWDREAILHGLDVEGVALAEIDYVICTHGHSDHVGNINLFSEATLIISHDVCEGDLYTFYPFAEGRPYRIDDEVDVIPTPGHTEQDISVIVRTVGGTYAIVGDLFECEEDLENDALWLCSSENPVKHRLSRERVLGLADFIVPGHGEMFEVKR